jgi:hypothetical protein
MLAGGLLVGLGGVASTQAFSQESRGADQFFAGVVSASSPEQLTVSRVLQGKNERRTFRITPETKFEGHLSADARVTVRFVSGDDGDVATLVIVRAGTKGKSNKK